MLVLSRDQDSGINIGSDIQIKVLSIKRQIVKLGIKAPKSVRVWRDELTLPLEKQQSTSGSNQSSDAMRMVLVVEDDANQAQLIRKALCQKQGTMVTVAETAQSALHSVGARGTSAGELRQPDLILLDLATPNQLGIDALHMIRSVPELQTTPVVVLGCDDEIVMRACMQAGANAFVPRAASDEDFQAQVSRIGQFWAGDCFARRRFDLADDVSATHPDNAAKTAADELKAPTAPEQAKRILVADDDPGHVMLIKRALRRGNINCDIDVVQNGVQAIDYLFRQGDFHRRQPAGMPDLMLLDLNMPKMNGRQVLQMLRNVGSSERLRLPPVVVLTSSDDGDDINDSYRLGAKSFIRKPVDSGQFARTVQQTTQYWLSLNEPLGPRTGLRSVTSWRMNIPR